MNDPNPCVWGRANGYEAYLQFELVAHGITYAACWVHAGRK